MVVCVLCERLFNWRNNKLSYFSRRIDKLDSHLFPSLWAIDKGGELRARIRERTAKDDKEQGKPYTDKKFRAEPWLEPVTQVRCRCSNLTDWLSHGREAAVATYQERGRIRKWDFQNCFNFFLWCKLLK